MTGNIVNYMIGKIRHLEIRNIWIFPRVMPLGCFHIPTSTVNVLAIGNGDLCPHVHNRKYEQRISLLRSKPPSSLTQVDVRVSQSFEVVRVSRSSSTNQSVVRVRSQFKPLKSHSRSQAVDVSSFSRSVDPVDSIQSKSDLINRHIYYDPRAFLSQIGSQNLSKVQAIFILNDVTIVCD